MVTQALGALGHATLEASGVEAGLQLARSALPDLILTDVKMEGADGFSFLQQLRRSHSTSAIPVIMMTGDPVMASQTGVRRGMELGADDFLVKPFRTASLVAAVQARLRKLEVLRQQADQTRHRLHEILEATIDIVAMAQAATWRLTYLNHAGRKLLGLAANQELGDLPLARLHSPAVATRLHQECIPTATREGFWKGELTLADAAGHEVPVREVILAHRSPEGEVEFISVIAHDITAARQARVRLQESETRYRTLVSGLPIPLFRTTPGPDGAFLMANPALAAMLGYDSVEDLLRTRVADLYLEPRERAAFGDTLLAQGRVQGARLRLRKKDGTTIWALVNACATRNDRGEVAWFEGTLEDITELKQSEEARNRMEVQLRQAQKLESIGQLAAGIAHEINTPTQYIGDNTRFLQDSFVQLRGLLAQYDRLLQAAVDQTLSPELLRETAATVAATDVPYLLEEIPKSIEQTLQGVERVSSIVRAMRDFSHPGSEEKRPVDLNQALRNTVTVARNEWRYVAELDLDLDPDLPPVPCLPGEVNQVFLNLLVNAAHAIGDVVGTGGTTKGRITVGTRRAGEWAEIRVQDTGTGIPEQVRSRIFDPFFTTKPVGRGTGQGLTIAHSVVVEKHGGTITFDTTVGAGTTFLVRLPLASPAPSGTS